jgi:hypothetical protein
MKTRDTSSRPGRGHAVPAHEHRAAVVAEAAGWSTAHDSPLQARINHSPRERTQRRAIDGAFGRASARSPAREDKRSFEAVQWQQAITQALGTADPGHVAEAVAIINRIEGLALEVPDGQPLQAMHAPGGDAAPVQRVLWPAVGQPAGAFANNDPVTLAPPAPGDDVVVLSCGHVYQQDSLAGLITANYTHCAYHDGASLTAGWMHGPAVMLPALAAALNGGGPVPAPGLGLNQVAQALGVTAEVIGTIVAIYFALYGGPAGRAIAISLLVAYYRPR